MDSQKQFLPGVSNLFDELGITQLSPEKREALELKIATVLAQSVLMRCIDVLTDPQKEELRMLLEAHPDNPDTLYDFLKKNVADFDSIASEEITKFRGQAAGFLGVVT